MKVLVVEDNQHMLGHLCDLLDKEGLQTVGTATGKSAVELYRREKPDFIFLDVVMEGISGYDICREIRKTDSRTPIIFISSKSETVDKIIGLEIGADDYIIKPFDIKEVTARIRAITRRCLAQNDTGEEDLDFFTLGDVAVYPQELTAKRDDRKIDLSLRDVKILKLLHKKKNQVVSRDHLIDHCWGRHITPESRTVDWHISQLRKKIEKDPLHPEIIQTVHGAGYKYATE